MRYLFELLVLGAAVVLVVLQPFRKQSFEITLALVLVVWGVLVWRFAGPGRRQPPKVLRVAELVIFNLCLFAVLAEGGLRIAGWVSSSPLLETSNDRSSRMIQKKKSRHRQGELRLGFPLNAQKYYDTEIVPRGAGRRGVVALGDSYSYGVVPHYFHFTTAMERLLPDTEVYNLGLPGIGPLEYLHILKTEALALDPDVVAINIFLGNDLADSIRGQKANQFMRYLLDRENLLLYQLPVRLWRVSLERRRSGRKRVGGVVDSERQELLTSLAEIYAAYPWIRDPSLERESLSQQRFLEVERKRATLICAQETDYSRLFEALSALRGAAGERPFVVFLIPDEFQINDALWGQVTRATRSGLRRRLPQRRIREWLDGEGITYLDLLPIFLKRCGRNNQRENSCYHVRDTHFNARGNRVAGQEMARFLAPLLGVEAP